MASSKKVDHEMPAVGVHAGTRAEVEELAASLATAAADKQQRRWEHLFEDEGSEDGDAGGAPAARAECEASAAATHGDGDSAAVGTSSRCRADNGARLISGVQPSGDVLPWYAAKRREVDADAGEDGGGDSDAEGYAADDGGAAAVVTDADDL